MVDHFGRKTFEFTARYEGDMFDKAMNASMMKRPTYLVRQPDGKFARLCHSDSVRVFRMLNPQLYATIAENSRRAKAGRRRKPHRKVS